MSKQLLILQLYKLPQSYYSTLAIQEWLTKLT